MAYNNSENSNIDNDLANFQQRQIKDHIRWFQDQAKPDQDVIFKIMYDGKLEEMELYGTGFANPSLLFFHGMVKGERTTFVQHLSQTNFILCTRPHTDPNTDVKRISQEILK